MPGLSRSRGPLNLRSRCLEEILTGGSLPSRTGLLNATLAVVALAAIVALTVYVLVNWP
jgi:hypothetical protein